MLYIPNKLSPHRQESDESFCLLCYGAKIKPMKHLFDNLSRNCANKSLVPQIFNDANSRVVSQWWGYWRQSGPKLTSRRLEWLTCVVLSHTLVVGHLLELACPSRCAVIRPRSRHCKTKNKTKPQRPSWQSVFFPPIMETYQQFCPRLYKANMMHIFGGGWVKISHFVRAIYHHLKKNKKIKKLLTLLRWETMRGSSEPNSSQLSSAVICSEIFIACIWTLRSIPRQLISGVGAVIVVLPWRRCRNTHTTTTTTDDGFHSLPHRNETFWCRTFQWGPFWREEAFRSVKLGFCHHFRTRASQPHNSAFIYRALENDHLRSAVRICHQIKTLW